MPGSGRPTRSESASVQAASLAAFHNAALRLSPSYEGKDTYEGEDTGAQTVRSDSPGHRRLAEVEKPGGPERCRVALTPPEELMPDKSAVLLGSNVDLPSPIETAFLLWAEIRGGESCIGGSSSSGETESTELVRGAAGGRMQRLSGSDPPGLPSNSKNPV